MSGKAHFQEGEHGPAFIEGPTTALSWLTVLPFHGAEAFDRNTGARVLASLPFVGVVLGAIGAALACTLLFFGAEPFLVAVLVVTAWELLNRFMHLDGLSDVADALGSYAPPERAREILGDPHAGLIGIASALLVLLVEVAGLATVYRADSLPQAAFFTILIPTIARAAGPIACHQHFQPMKPTGFAALMIGTVRTWWILAWDLLILGCAAAMAILLGPRTFVAAALALIVSQLLAIQLARHCNKRFEGLNGDTTGFTIAIAGAVAAACVAVCV